MSITFDFPHEQLIKLEDVVVDRELPSQCLSELMERAKQSKKYDIFYVLESLNWSRGSHWRREIWEDGSRWTKRFTKYNPAVRGETEFVSILGEIVSRYAKIPQNMYFEIAKYGDWKPGNFGDRDNSCWWNSYNNNRLSLMADPRGHSVLFYSSEEDYNLHKRQSGIARCWAIIDPAGEFTALFNAYGMQLNAMATALSKFWNDMPFSKQTISMLGTYINGGEQGNAVAVGKDRGTAYILGKYQRFEDDAIVIADYRVRVYCTHCMSDVTDALGNRNVNNRMICDNCFEANYYVCGGCGNYEPNNTSTDVRRNRNQRLKICPTCQRDFGFICHIHGASIGENHRVWHTNRIYCMECVQAGTIIYCAHCGRNKDKFKKVGPVSVCLTCNENLKKAKLIDNSKLGKATNEVINA